ncbi:hypothetical protein SAMN00790413_03375 [Deinococcus hopiensis KR-140]|uniref:Uncharacterized protein n=1 Tax=Deinococcus hopiensis KR-140 TaxID=695939 RepID=A0A1W1UWJ9_9DEIO|nr:hypothetical protein SAMN00790413_03375 [Deinococcus hopiensis KR-140]
MADKLTLSASTAPISDCTGPGTGLVFALGHLPANKQ